MSKKYYDFVEVLKYNGKLLDLDDIIKWNKYKLFGFANFTFTNICLGNTAPILMLLWDIIGKKEKNKN